MHKGDSSCTCKSIPDGKKIFCILKKVQNDCISLKIQMENSCIPHIAKAQFGNGCNWLQRNGATNERRERPMACRICESLSLVVPSPIMIKFLLLFLWLELANGWCRCEIGSDGEAVECRREVDIAQAKESCPQAKHLLVLGSLEGGICDHLDINEILCEPPILSHMSDKFRILIKTNSRIPNMKKLFKAIMFPF